MLKDIDLESAIDLVRKSAALLESEDVALPYADGRVLAEDVFASIDQPAFPRSPLDGYALHSADSEGASVDAPVKLRVVEKIYAGDWTDRRVERGECVRLMTGAVIPDGCDCVIRQEDTDCGEETVAIYLSLNEWRNYCFKGEDFRTGSLLLSASERIGPAAVAVFASAGVAKLRVVRKPVVAFVSTGSELIRPGEAYSGGKVYESSSYYMSARLAGMGVDVSDIVTVKDDERDLTDCLRKATAGADLVITTGGVSVGERDLLPGLMQSLGAERVFHGIEMKPGSPTMFSVLDGVNILSLSGNPFAAITGFELLAWPILSGMTGDESLLGPTVRGELKSSFRKRSDTRRFLRGYFDGRGVTLPESHDNGQIRSLIGCNCLVDIPEGSDSLKEGDAVNLLLLPGRGV
jgi:molybdopterin molybdotransferase